MKQIKTSPLIIFVAVLLFVGGFVIRESHTQAAATITVNSTADDQDNDGECTLREAIIAANTDTASGVAANECVAGDGVDTIEFAIAEPADFTNGGEDGYIISPISTLPNIDEQVIINGYSQPGSEANSSVSPNPFNGKLLIEIEGAGGQSHAFRFQGSSGSSEIRGVSMYGFEDSPILALAAPNVVVQGNYIGVDHTGTSGTPSCAGLGASNNGNSSDHTSSGALIGGLDPEDRNILSNNSDPNCGFASAGYPDSDWVIQGNYIGLAPDGVTAVPNSMTGGSGGLSIDNNSGVIVGGTSPGATNVISGNNNMGIAPHTSDDLTIQGNYIGTDYTGTVAVPNNGSGIALGASTDVLIGGNNSSARNIISGNSADGMFLNENNNVTIQGNYIGVDVNQDPMPNDDGIGVSDSTGIIGGVNAGEGNIIANSINGAAINVAPSGQASILGNSMYGNDEGGILLDSGVHPNDPLDSDTGSNNHLNYPEDLEYYESLGNTHIDFNLDVPAGQYRIEFFSNTAAHSSGHGEGETFLGYQNITSDGTGSQSFSASLSGVSHSNITSTATLVDSGAEYGFTGTSSFSTVAEPAPDFIDLSLTKTLADPENVVPSGNIHYDLTLTNVGYTPYDISFMDGSGSPLNGVFVDFLPPELTYVSSSNPDLTCTDTGTTFATLLATGHADYNVIICTYTGGGSEILSEGETFSTTFEVAIASESDLVFTNHAIGAMLASSDLDSLAMGNAAGNSVGGGGSPDFIDTMIDLAPNNFASAVFPIPAEEASTNTETISDDDSLAESGRSLIAVMGIVIATLTIGSLTLWRRRFMLQ